ncbi:MAG: hypothetical protein II581_04165 [Oscillospiraceae bacterium]|nr:hypothetical protein [Oscillospiraceae bacterium]
MKNNRAKTALVLALILMFSLLAACSKSGSGAGKAEPSVPAAPTQTTARATEPTETEPVETEPTETEPVETEPAATNPVATEPKEIVGETVTFGGYSFLVPEGYELKEPGEFSYYDFSVRKSDFRYFDFVTSDSDELIMSKYEYNKQTYTNEQVDVEAVCGEIAWTGFQYSDGWGGYGFEVYASLGGKLIRVASAGFPFDSADAKAVLGSITAQ